MPIFPKKCMYCYEPTESSQTFFVYTSEVTKQHIFSQEVSYKYGNIRFPICNSCIMKLRGGNNSIFSVFKKQRVPTKDNWGKLLNDGTFKFTNKQFQEEYERLNDL